MIKNIVNTAPYYMQNIYLTFNNIEVDDYIFEDFTNFYDYKNIINKIIDTYLTTRLDNIFYTKVADNELIEAISYRIYNTTHFWELLLIINNINNINDLPKDYDYILNKTLEDVKKIIFLKEDVLDKYYDDLVIKVKNNEYIDDSNIVFKEYNKLLQYNIDKNEEFRFIKYFDLDTMNNIQIDIINEFKSLNIL